jgi:N utilization substance protein A
VIDELGGEKIDIIEWNESPAKFISNALSPAKVLHVELAEEKREARVSVPTDQLSLAIGKQGQNVRLAAKLTGWKIDVVGGETKTEEPKKEELEKENAAAAEEKTGKSAESENKAKEKKSDKKKSIKKEKEEKEKNK